MSPDTLSPLLLKLPTRLRGGRLEIGVEKANRLLVLGMALPEPSRIWAIFA
jgi:hypothetical protein